MGGALVFHASRVPAQTLLDYLDDGHSLDEFLEVFPSVAREDAEEFLLLARERSMPIVAVGCLRNEDPGSACIGDRSLRC